MKVQHNTYAFNAKEQCVIAAISQEADGPFKCVICGQKLSFKNGPIRERYFSHPKESSCNAGNVGMGESKLHKGAKRIVRENINKIQLYECCGYNQCANHTDLWASNLFRNTDVYYAKEEHPLTISNNKYVVDVAVKEKGSEELCAVIEVWHTHRTKVTKANDLYTLFKEKDRGLVVEVSVEDVLQCLETYDVPVWRLQNRLFYTPCKECTTKIERLHHNAQKGQPFAMSHLQRQEAVPLPLPSVMTHFSPPLLQQKKVKEERVTVVVASCSKLVEEEGCYPDSWIPTPLECKHCHRKISQFAATNIFGGLCFDCDCDAAFEKRQGSRTSISLFK